MPNSNKSSFILPPALPSHRANARLRVRPLSKRVDIESSYNYSKLIRDSVVYVICISLILASYSFLWNAVYGATR